MLPVLAGAMAGLSLVVLATCVHVFGLLRIPLVSEHWHVNGLIAGGIATIVLVGWLRRSLKRPLSESGDATSSAGAAWAAVTASVAGWLSWRAAAPVADHATTSAVGVLMILSVGAWFAGTRMLLAWFRGGAHGQMDLWGVVFPAITAGSLAVTWGAWFGGVPGALTGIAGSVWLWRWLSRVSFREKPAAELET